MGRGSVRLRVGCSRVGMPFSTLAVDGSGVEMAVAGAAAAAIGRADGVASAWCADGGDGGGDGPGPGLGFRLASLWLWLVVGLRLWLVLGLRL